MAIFRIASQQRTLPRLSAMTRSGRDPLPVRGPEHLLVFRRDFQQGVVADRRKDRLAPKEDRIGIPLRGKGIVQLKVGRKVRDAAVEAHGRVEDDFRKHDNPGTGRFS